MDLRNSNGIELGNFYFTTVSKLFPNISIRSGKMYHVELNSGTSIIYFCTFKDIDLRESHAKLNKKPSETLGTDSI